MKIIKYLILAMLLFVLACQNKSADRNMNDDAILMEDAKVKSEKPDTTYFEHNKVDTVPDQY